ncbi:MAG: hypothetical protein PHS75_10790 [Anaerolineaceae bacterium]|nr:hypothetical protein [Anaerolineaceae bacterium]
MTNKSEISIASAKILYGKGCCSSVAHCAYFACYQKSKHIWLHKMGKTEQELKNLCDQKKHEGSHEVLINEISKFIKSSQRNNAISDFRTYNSNILQLKKLRKIADYDDTIFDHPRSNDSIRLSEETIPVLNKYLN